MEGPSLVIATEELSPFKNRTIKQVGGSGDFAYLKGEKIKGLASWGKHLLILFPEFSFRIHFLMFGSYRINNPRENRTPKLELTIGADRIYFYSCAIKRSEGNIRKEYDWSNDLMSEEWDAKAAVKKLRAKPEAMLCDLLMDQNIFSGLGNIIKNEVLFRLRFHPELKLQDLTPARQLALTKDARKYSLQFYEWKKQNVLKRNWKIFRKKKCPECGGKVTKKATGKLARISHFCPRCQPKKT